MMFKKTRWKIVITIMTVLVLLWAGTLGIIYGSSYYEVSNRNRDMLRQHAEMYMLPHDTDSNLPDFDTESNKPGHDTVGGIPGHDTGASMPEYNAGGGMQESFSRPEIVPAPDPGAPHFKDTPAFQLLSLIHI